jgi:hopanoid biosynthesis associated protein HpnK
LASKRLIVCADDFGLDPAVNEAVEAAHRDGILTCASLMVGAPAASEAAALARRLPSLRVGLHIVLVDGRPVSLPEEIPALLRPDGAFRDDMVGAGFRFFFLPEVRRQLAHEIRAQFEAFRATGLALDHANAHKHMHLHPTVARLILEIGRDYGLGAMRVPAEPRRAVRSAAPPQRRPVRALASDVGPALLDIWTGGLRRRLRRAGVATNDHLFGLAWTGGMTESRLLSLLPHVPDGVSEIYFHPATERTQALARTMPDYRHPDELAALVSPAVRRRIDADGFSLISYRDIAAARS